MISLVNGIFTEFWTKFVSFLPNLLGGLLILIIGLAIADVLKRILLSIFSFFKLERLFQDSKVMDKGEVRLWEEVLVEVLRWTVVVLFLIPTLEVWGLSRATSVLNEFVLYLPNVIVAVVIGFVGLVSSNLVADLVKRTVKTMGSGTANTLGVFTKTTIVFFTALVVLNQLGVAQDLVKILFTGIVGMLAIAGGLAFGLGGREMAKEVLEELKKKVK